MLTLQIGPSSSRVHDTVTLMFYQPLKVAGKTLGCLCAPFDRMIGQYFSRCAEGRCLQLAVRLVPRAHGLLCWIFFGANLLAAAQESAQKLPSIGIQITLRSNWYSKQVAPENWKNR
ncbi:hypothetical protein C6A77_16350 [Pseudomonas sp. AFG_SD02_1510_Pfu_092]|nr:hypothetical protein C6A77_16350 [Pseudomonas sp. AFG_SD02_1510_Pfu_092]